MRLPVDTSPLTCFAVSEPEAVVDFETKRPRTDEDGRPLFAVQVVVRYGDQSEIWPVKVVGEPAAEIEPGVPVALDGLVAVPWAMGERWGMAYRAQAIRPLPVRPGRGGERPAPRVAS